MSRLPDPNKAIAVVEKRLNGIEHARLLRALADGVPHYEIAARFRLSRPVIHAYARAIGAKKPGGWGSKL